MFADDMTLYTSHRNAQDAAARVSEALTALCAELDALGLLVNQQKSVCMVLSKTPLQNAPHISMCGERLEAVPNVRCLGIVIDDRLSWTPHMSTVSFGRCPGRSAPSAAPFASCPCRRSADMYKLWSSRTCSMGPART